MSYEYYDETATVAASMDAIVDNIYRLLEEFRAFSEYTCDYPQTALQLLLQAYYNCNNEYCNTGNRIASCMLSADTRPVSEILDDANKLRQHYSKEAESRFISSLIGRLLLKEL